MKVFSLATVAFAAVTYEGSAGLDSGVRSTGLVHFELPTGDFTFYSSVQGKVEGNAVVKDEDYEASASGKISANGVFGGFGVGLGLRPSTLLTSFTVEATASADVTATLEAEAALFAAGFDANVEAAAGVVGMSYIDLVEKDADGKIVKRVDFYGGALCSGFSGCLNWDVGAVVNSDDDKVHYTEHIGTQIGTDVQVKFTTIASDYAGQISTGALVTPTSVETVFEVTGWEYENAANQLTLRMGMGSASVNAIGSATGTANGELQADAVKRVVAGAGDSKMFTDFSKYVTVDGDKQTSATVTIEDYNKLSADADARVEGLAGADLLGAAKVGVQGVASANANSEVSVNLVQVQFPAGATSITYDPVVGAGEPPMADATSGVSALAASAVSLIALLAL